MIDVLLLGIENRGKHATGIATITTLGDVDVEKADLAASDYIKWRRESILTKKTRSILLHTRFATQGKPENLDNNHPITYENVVAIHNGHISNDSELFKSENLPRIAEVDSEIIAALFNKYGLDKAHIPLQKLDGNYAVAVGDARVPNDLILAKGPSSPLVWVNFNGMYIWASTHLAISNAVEVAFGKKISYANTTELAYGKLLYLQNGNKEELEFKPYTSYGYGYGKYEWISDGWSSSDKRTYKRSMDEKPMKRSKIDRETTKYLDADTDIDSWVYEGTEYILCIDCDTAVVKSNAFWVSNIPFCADCYDNSNYVHNYVNNGTIDEDNIDQILLEEHETIIKKIADEFRVSEGFVDWLLFDSGIEDGKITSLSLQDQYLEFSIRYEELYEELLEENDDDEEEDAEVDDFSFVNKETIKLLEETSSCKVLV